jgi:hypothetical protein
LGESLNVAQPLTRSAVVLTTVIAVIAILQLIYARTMSRRAVIR